MQSGSRLGPVLGFVNVVKEHHCVIALPLVENLHAKKKLSQVALKCWVGGFRLLWNVCEQSDSIIEHFDYTWKPLLQLLHLSLHPLEVSRSIAIGIEILLSLASRLANCIFVGVGFLEPRICRRPLQQSTVLFRASLCDKAVRNRRPLIVRKVGQHLQVVLIVISLWP